jgi:hypothetical protein
MAVLKIDISSDGPLDVIMIPGIARTGPACRSRISPSLDTHTS